MNTWINTVHRVTSRSRKWKVWHFLPVWFKYLDSFSIHMPSRVFMGWNNNLVFNKMFLIEHYIEILNLINVIHFKFILSITIYYWNISLPISIFKYSLQSHYISFIYYKIQTWSFYSLFVVCFDTWVFLLNESNVLVANFQRFLKYSLHLVLFLFAC